MADLSDVEKAMVEIAASSLGLGSSYLAGSLVVSPTIGVKCRVFRGWPVANRLDADLKDGVANVSVFPVMGGSKNVTRHFLQWKAGTAAAPTLTASVSGATVTFGGVGGVGQVAGVFIGPAISGTSYAYRLSAGDSPSTVAAALQAQIPGSSVNGLDLMLSSDLVVARVAADQQQWMETRRQQQQIDVIGWCPSPVVRDQVMSLVDAGFANLLDQYGRLTDQFGLPDGSDAILCYVANRTNDLPQQANLWRRDLRYRVEYPTTLLQTQPIVLFTPGINLTGGGPISVTIDDGDGDDA